MPLKLPAKGRHRKSPSELVGVDIGTTGLKVVRMKQSKDDVAVISADILPPIHWNGEDQPERIKLPKNLMANYTALTVSGEKAVVRLLNLPGHVKQSELEESAIREHVSVNKDFRISFTILPAVRGKQETRVLVVAIPEEQVKAALKLVPSGPPAPFSLEVAGLAALSSFMHGPGGSMGQEALGVVESGARVTFLALFYKKTLALVRKFDFGAESLVQKVQEQLGVDRETAEGIISDGSFDISQPVHEVMDPFLRQLTISKDFVERREDCRVAAIYLSGGTNLSRYWLEEVKAAAAADVVSWNPFEGLSVPDGAYPSNLNGQETRFSAAVGACLGVFEGE